MNDSKDHKAAAEPPLDCRIRATLSLCCGTVRAGWREPDVMHDGTCRDRHGGELGPTYYMHDSGLVMDACGAMLPRSNAELRDAPPALSAERPSSNDVLGAAGPKEE